jgi:hypothetical protein
VLNYFNRKLNVIISVFIDLLAGKLETELVFFFLYFFFILSVIVIEKVAVGVK